MSRPTGFAAAVAAVLFLAGCAHDRLAGPLEPVRPLTSVETQVAGANTAFGLGLLQQIHGEEPAGNVLVSPLSASMALGMTMNGAAGPTWDAMRAALGFGTLEEAQVNEAYRGLIRQLRSRDRKVEFRLANSIWHDRAFQVKSPFLQAARDYFDAEVAALDFRSPAAPRTISSWAERETGGRIRDLVESIDPLDVMILVNAVYFKAPWQTPFEPAATAPRPFTRDDGRVVQVPTMLRDGGIPHMRNPDVQLVELPYADGAFSMVVLAPAGGAGLDRLVAQLTPERWQQWMDGLETGRIMLTMPKFRFEYDIDMNAALAGLGMGIAFQPFVADFRRIADVDDLHISKVRQKAFIDVHELGTEAAAATSVTMSVTSMPPEFRFDHPFLFAIRERESGALLFLGRVGDPAA
jgi:serine protease inhibitor